MAILEVLTWDFQLWRRGLALWTDGIHSHFDEVNKSSHHARYCALAKES